MMVVAFYTEKTPYEEEVKHLEYSCVQQGLKYHIEGYENRGAWVHNCAIKPEFILDMLSRFPLEPLLYVDADAVFKHYPSVIFNMVKEGKVDLAAHIMKGGVLLSGTIYFRNCDKVKVFVHEWIKMQKKDPNKWDQKTLHETLVQHGPRLDINFEELPQEYCKIYDKDWGIPVIQHNQKSREYREKVKMSILKGVPSSVSKQRITVHGDGSFTIPRNHREAEKYLDAHYRRVPGEKRWFKIAHVSKKLEELETVFKDRHCYIVGKGPSLDDLTHQAFSDAEAPVIAINEAIHKVESLGLPNPTFVLQQDMGLRDNCLPQSSGIFISQHAQHWYAESLNKYVYDPVALGLQNSQLSVICAIEIAKKLGTVSFDLISFDACVNRKVAYAKCIGHDSSVGGNPKRFLSHRKHIDKHIKGIKTNWVIPTSAPSLTSLGTPSKPQERLEEHREPEDAQPLKLKPGTLDLF